MPSSKSVPCAQGRERRKADDRERDKKRAEIERKIAGIMRAIEDGLYESAMKARMATLKTEKASREAAPEDLHPRLPELYRRKVEELERVLDGPDRAEAMENGSWMRTTPKPPWW